MEGIAVEYSPSLFYPGNNEVNFELYSYISDNNEQDACDSYDHMYHIFETY